MAKLALGNREEATHPDCLRAVLAEIVLTFLFVFAGVASAMAAGKMFGGGDSIMGLTAVALTHALVVAVMVSVGLHISGGHINPAVTLGLAVGGHITLVRSVLYIIAQLIGSSLACLLLRFLTGGLDTPVHTLAVGVGSFQGVIWEIVLTFSLLFSIYGTIVDPKKAITPGLGPLLVGLVVGANVLAGGPFSGASMNPARSFGPALATWNWTDHWVYWVGPLIGGPLASLVYELVFLVRSHAPLPRDDDGAF
ncbi:LOW QUALITY PROTEIN: probable aquaporin TIP4-3 [Dioscorea cayenensis subsp. rotundata]|uniref:LOW QUALITY PROTEIN: probable aquaporin TIP4-3 n=1 Tax=Dioscorea cayennensis subsp. rotundata TaxID=55577 RepID=A0AB40AM24_DIOCR|nr:LOW QUALITY PROTEIN: probable aquaporin TIP4-3 [Dioscorea cayenensis subsp. rotundata]